MNNLINLKNPFGVQHELSVVTIQVEHFSYWIVATLQKFFANLFNKSIKTIDLNLPMAEIQNSLGILFLGDYNIYFVNGSDLDYPEHKKWVDFLENYKGPHKIIFFTLKNKISNNQFNAICFSQEIDFVSAKDICSIFYNINLSPKLFISKKILLSDLFILMAYQNILPKNLEDQQLFISSWLNNLMSPNKSLYLLSQYLFNMDAISFFNYWNNIKNLYSNEYWVSYWSDQIYQAIIFIDNCKTDLVSAKAQARKLPFSFVNGDYNKFTIDSLVKFHNQLYILDYNIKMGISSLNIEYWYHQVLNNKIFE